MSEYFPEVEMMYTCTGLPARRISWSKLSVLDTHCNNIGIYLYHFYHNNRQLYFKKRTDSPKIEMTPPLIETNPVRMHVNAS